jgi:hypothetical protein
VGEGSVEAILTVLFHLQLPKLSLHYLTALESLFRRIHALIMTPAMLSNQLIGNGMSAIHQIGRHLKREEQSAYNRLLSVQRDAQYVQSFRRYALK